MQSDRTIILYAEVVFNLKIDKSFTYRIPHVFSSALSVGQRIMAPFGRRELTGIVIQLVKTAPAYECKDIIDILDDKPLITTEMLELARWMSEYYMTSLGQTLQLALPKGLERRSRLLVSIEMDADINAQDLTDNQRHLYDTIARDPNKPTSYYKKKFGTGSFDYNLRTLKDKNLINLYKHITSERVRQKTTRFVTVSSDFVEKLSVLRKRDELLPVLLPLQGKTISYQEFREKTRISPQRIKTMQTHNILKISESESFRQYQLMYREEKKEIQLNDEQNSAVREIERTLRSASFKVFLLHGVTGSGKTQVYLEAIQSALAEDKSAIVLIPEISLTPQTVGRFESFFPGMVHAFHSKMSLGERYDTWRKVRQTGKGVVIGPRSALFLPIKDLGIIIVDEEHDTSYKQEGQVPRYHARDTAIYRARMNNATVVLGSATPSLESFQNAHQQKYQLLKLERRIEDLAMPEVHIVDLKDSYQKGDEYKVFSPLLIDKIRDRLEKQEQVILLQNRRGFSSFLQCKECGFTTKCPNCEIYLTYHTSFESMQCHYCGYSVKAAHICPKCTGTQIKYIGIGTQQIEREIFRLFPDVRVLRMDIDTTTARGAHGRILQRFREGKADILLGTQMIAKGLDFEKVSLVGVISADIGLTFPDFRSAERVFQLLTQVAGRSGRKYKQGEVVIQTRMEKHYAVKFARRHDYNGFYQKESKLRKISIYPPFCRLIKIGVSSPDKIITSHKAMDIVKSLRKYSQKYFDIIGPAPSPVARLKNKYRWQILLKINIYRDPSGKHTRQLLRDVFRRYKYDQGDSMSVIVDIDPVDMM